MLWHNRNDPIAGHFGLKRTLELVARKYYWPGIARKVKAYTWACLTCQRICPVRHRLHESMELLPQLRGPWTDTSMDFILSLQVSHWKHHAKPHNTILVVVNWYTKQVRYFPCHDTPDVVGLAEILTMKLVL